MLSNGATLYERLLVDLVNLDKDFRDLAQREGLRLQKRLQVPKEDLLVELAEE